VPVWRTCRVIDYLASGRDLFSGRDREAEAIEKLGGADRAAHCLELYLRLKSLPSVAKRRDIAASLLGRCGAEGARPLLFALGDPDGVAREKALEALQRTGLPTSTDLSLILRMLGDGVERVRAQAAYTLGQVAATRPEIVPALTNALGDEYWDVRCGAALSLGKMGLTARAAIPQLTVRVGDRFPDVRIAAAWALGEMGPEARAAVPALTIALGDIPTELRVGAASTLGKIGPAAREAGPALARLSEDQSQKEGVRTAAAEALKKIRGEEPPK